MKILGYNVKLSRDIKKKMYSGGTQSLIRSISGSVKINNSVFFDLYKRNGDIRQAVNKISLAVSKNGLIIEDKKGNIINDETIVNGITSLIINPTFLKFKKELFKQYLITGELYIVPLMDIGNQFVGLEVLDSRSIYKIYNKDGNIIGFIQNGLNGKQIKFTRDEIAFYKYENSVTNANDGMGLLEGVVWDALADLESSKRNYYFHENNATPDSILLLNDDMSIEEQKNAVEIFKREYKGSENAHKTAVVGGIKDIKTVSVNNKDMEFINQRKLTIEKVSAVMGVPKNILGYTENINLSNGVELRKEYLEGTIKPLEKDFEYIINSSIMKFNSDITDRYTIKASGETLEDTIILEEGQRKDLELGILTIDEIRKQRQLDVFNIEETKKPIIKNNIVLLEDIGINDTAL